MRQRESVREKDDLHSITFLVHSLPWRSEIDWVERLSLREIFLEGMYFQKNAGGSNLELRLDQMI